MANNNHINCCDSPKVQNFSDSRYQVTKIKVSSFILRIWQYLLIFFTKSQELVVRQHSNRLGNTWWSVYDPITSKSIVFGSEAEILMWIEKRHL